MKAISCSVMNKEADKIIKDELISWYREHAKVKINERVEKYRKILEVNPNNVVIKKQPIYHLKAISPTIQ